MAKKSYTRRIRVTKGGKLLHRKTGIGHAKAKKSCKANRQKRNLTFVSKADKPGVTETLERQ